MKNPKPPKKPRLAASAVDAAFGGDQFAAVEQLNASFLERAQHEQLHLARLKAAREAAAPAAAAAAAAAAAPPRAALRGAPSAADPAERARREERRRRFLEEQAAAAAAASVRVSAKTLVQARAEGGAAPALGTNEQLEKEYLRLTSLPAVDDVRPPRVLAAALEHVKVRWAADGDYAYALAQLKSIRQDLTVQRLRGGLAAAVYETHGRVAAEVGDWAEHRQCCAVLQGLYDDAGAPRGAAGEFSAYAIMLAASVGRAALAHELAAAAARLRRRRPPGAPPGALGDDPCVAHALAVVSAHGAANWVRFLRLYADAPRMSPYLMDLLLGTLRPAVYAAALAAFPPALDVKALAGWQGFGSGREALAWLRARGAVVGPGGELDVRASRAGLARYVEAEAAGAL